MNRLARSSIALGIVVTIATTVTGGIPTAEAAPSPVVPVHSIDVSTSGIECLATPSQVDDGTGLTLTITAAATSLTVAGIAHTTAKTDGLPPVMLPIHASWQHGCLSQAQGSVAHFTA